MSTHQSLIKDMDDFGRIAAALSNAIFVTTESVEQSEAVEGFIRQCNKMMQAFDHAIDNTDPALHESLAEVAADEHGRVVDMANIIVQGTLDESIQVLMHDEVLV